MPVNQIEFMCSKNINIKKEVITSKKYIETKIKNFLLCENIKVINQNEIKKTIETERFENVGSAQYRLVIEALII